MSHALILYILGGLLSFLYELFTNLGMLKSIHDKDPLYSRMSYRSFIIMTILLMIPLSAVWPLTTIIDLYHTIKNDETYNSTEIK